MPNPRRKQQNKPPKRKQQNKPRRLLPAVVARAAILLAQAQVAQQQAAQLSLVPVLSWQVLKPLLAKLPQVQRQLPPRVPHQPLLQAARPLLLLLPLRMVKPFRALQWQEPWRLPPVAALPPRVLHQLQAGLSLKFPKALHQL